MTCGVCGLDLLPGAPAHVDLFDNPICGPCYAGAMERDGLVMEIETELDEQARADERDAEYDRLHDPCAYDDAA